MVYMMINDQMMMCCVVFEFVLSTLLAVRCVTRCAVCCYVQLQRLAEIADPPEGQGKGAAGGKAKKAKGRRRPKKWGFVFCGDLLIG